jgi:thiol:disulfide interchange protein DsbC
MHSVIRLPLVVISLFFTSVAYCATPSNQPITTAQKNAVNRAVEKLSKQTGQKIPVSNITSSPIPGLLQVTSDMSIFYITSDGEYLLAGDLLDLNKDKHSWSLTENETRALRVKALAAVSESDMIIYPATGKKKIGTITVFTDLDCPYCHKMQQHIGEYNDLGITVRYLAFPRAGTKSKSFEEAVRIWCAADKAKAYNTAVELKEYPKETCKNSPVQMEFDLGQKMGITGTPTIILDNGAKIGGLVQPAELAKIIAESRKN